MGNKSQKPSNNNLTLPTDGKGRKKDTRIDDDEEQEEDEVDLKDIFTRNPPAIGWIIFDIVFWFVILLFNFVLLSTAWNNPCYSNSVVQLIFVSILLATVAIFLAVAQWIGYSISVPFMVTFRMIRVLITTLLYYTLFAEVYLIASQHTMWNSF